MISASGKTILSKDLENKKLLIQRDFKAPIETVWKYWTSSDLLDLWWAPKPWKANTISHMFKEGGKWIYFMEGPNGEKHYALFDYHEIVPNNFFIGQDSFCDEDGKLISVAPSMHWKVSFQSAEFGTRVEVVISFQHESDIEKIIEMGFETGFAMAHDNLDEILN